MTVKKKTATKKKLPVKKKPAAKKKVAKKKVAKKKFARKPLVKVSETEYEKTDMLTGAKKRYTIQKFPGHPKSFDTPDILWTECITYLQGCLDREEPPTVLGLAAHCGCSTRTLNEYASGKNDTDGCEYSLPLEAARTIIADRKLVGGLMKQLDSGLVKFDLINNHGYTDKVSTEITGQGGGPVEMRDVSNIELARRIAWLFHEASKESKNARASENGLHNDSH